MKKKKYVSNWLSNASMASVIVGGFQQMELWLHLLALGIAIATFCLGYRLNKED